MCLVFIVDFYSERPIHLNEIAKMPPCNVTTLAWFQKVKKSVLLTVPSPGT